MTLALMCYWLNQALAGYLVLTLLRRKSWRDYPAFTAYVSLGAIRSLLLFGLYQNKEWYLIVWQSGRPIDFVLKVGIAVGLLNEVLPSLASLSREHKVPKLGTAILGFAALIPAPFLIPMNVPLERTIGFVLAGTMALLAIFGKELRRESYGIICGLFTISFLTAISALAQRIPHGSFLQFVPVFSYTVALSVWIRGFRQEAV